MTIDQFIRQWGITATFKPWKDYDDPSGMWRHGAYHFKVKLKSNFIKGKVKSEFHLGHACDWEDDDDLLRQFIQSIARDVQMGEYDFYYFVDELGTNGGSTQEVKNLYYCWNKCVEAYRQWYDLIGKYGIDDLMSIEEE